MFISKIFLGVCLVLLWTHTEARSVLESTAIGGAVRDDPVDPVDPDEPTESTAPTGSTAPVDPDDPIVPPTCPKINDPVNDIFAPGPECYSYYVCSWGVAVKVDCLDGVAWDATNNVCDFTAGPCSGA